jgi:hypothetical protein
VNSFLHDWTSTTFVELPVNPCYDCGFDGFGIDIGRAKTENLKSKFLISREFPFDIGSHDSDIECYFVYPR